MKTFYHDKLIIRPRYRLRRANADTKSYRSSLNEQRYTSSVHFTK